SLAERFAGARQIFTQQLLEDIFSFNDIETVVKVLHFHVNENRNKLNNEGIQWIEDFKNNFSDDKIVGLKFLGQVATLMKDDSVIEKNEALQNRIIAAANHFEPKFSAYHKSILNHPLITEHRETANVINEYLNQLILAIYTINYFLQYCKQLFSVTSFLQHKLKFAQPQFNVSAYASGKKQSFTDIPNVELYDTLKRWRDDVCDKSGMPIYMVANRVTLTEVATYLPLNKKDLLQISGFGKAKVDKYGDDILQAVQEYCSANNLATNIAAKEENPKRQRKEKNDDIKTDTKTVSYNLFKEGKSVAEIAKERNFAVSTIEGHLVWFVGNGDIDIN
ncbi:MAG: HRDC domain-containing protein, partial [Ginsengibacter sp.]